jgi:glucose-6-phosphate isomerase
MSPYPLTISLDLALSGKGAPPKDGFDRALADAVSALAWLRDAAENQSVELLSIPARKDDIKQASARAAEIVRSFRTVVVLGIGGSSLGGQALTVLKKPGSPQVEFHDNPDPFSWSAALKRFDPKKTHFVAISKSGGTAETLMQVLTAADALEKAGVKSLSRHFTIITEPHDSALAAFADHLGAKRLEHPTGVGGRYSVLTMVGLLPAILMGVDVKKLRAGAQSVLDATLGAKTPMEAGPAAGAALAQALAAEGKLATTILWPYVDQLAVFGGWWRQLWAESLGKDGKGSTPVSVLGPVDQHSQLQLFRDGPGNALFTLVTVNTKGKGPQAPRAQAKKLKLDYLAGKRLGDLVDAEARATAQTLFKNGRPVRTIHLAKVDEFHMGALMMHFMLETMLMGRLMGVDPFNQPGVEEGKVLARQYLADGS